MKAFKHLTSESLCLVKYGAKSVESTDNLSPVYKVNLYKVVEAVMYIQEERTPLERAETEDDGGVKEVGGRRLREVEMGFQSTTECHCISVNI